MRITAQDTSTEIVVPEDLDKVLNLTVDQALEIALAHIVDNELEESWYVGLLSKLGETEQNAFTMGLAAESIKVQNRELENLQDEFEQIAYKQGCIYEDDYDKLMHHITNARLVRDINTWLVASGLPMKPNQPKKPISDKYKKEVKDMVKHPNVNKIKGRRLAQSPDAYFGNPYLGGFPMESRKTAANYTIEVIDTLNDQVVQNIRGDNDPEGRFQQMLDKYGDRLDEYVIQLLKNGDVVKDSQGSGGTIRDFNARRHIAGEIIKYVVEDPDDSNTVWTGEEWSNSPMSEEWYETEEEAQEVANEVGGIVCGIFLGYDDNDDFLDSKACLKRTMRRLRAQQEEMFDKDVYEDKPRSKTIGEVLASIKDKWVNYGDVDYLTHGGIQLKWDGGEGVEFIDFGYSEDGWWGYTGGDVDIGSMMENYQNLMNAYGSFENIPITEIIWDKSAREVIRYAGGEEIPEDEEDAIGSLWSLLLGYPSYWGGSEERILRAEEIAEELSELSGIEISAKDVAKDLLTNEQYEALEEVGIEMSEFVEQKIRNMLPKDLDID